MSKKIIYITLLLLSSLLIQNVYADSSNIYEHIVYHSNDVNCNYLQAPIGRKCLESYDSGMRLYDYDENGLVIRIIEVDNFINYIPNPSFKYNGGNLDNFWSTYGDISSESRIENNIYLTKNSGIDGTSYGGIRSERFFVKPNQQYTLSFDHTGDLSSGSVSSMIRCYPGMTGVHSQQSGSGFTPSSNWERSSATITTDSVVELCQVWFYFVNDDANGYFNITNVQFEKGTQTDFFNINTFLIDVGRDERGGVNRVVDPKGVSRTYTNNLVGETVELGVNNLIINHDFTQHFSNSLIGWEVTGSTNYNSANNYITLEPSASLEQKNIPVRNDLDYEIIINYRGTSFDLQIQFLDDQKEIINTISADTPEPFSEWQDVSFTINNIPRNTYFINIQITGTPADIRSVRLTPLTYDSEIININYTTRGLINNIQYPFGSTDYLYNTNNLVKQIITNRSGDILFNEKYEYDEAGNLILISSFGNEVKFEYDSLHRIIEADYDAGFLYGTFSGVINWFYDRLGNILSKDEAGAESQLEYYEGTNRLRFDGVNTYTYTDSGNVESKTNNGMTINYEYDGMDRLYMINHSHGPKVTYHYKAGFLQRSTINDEIAKIYIYDITGSLLYSIDFGRISVSICDPGEFNITGNTFTVERDGEVKAIVDNRGYMNLSGVLYENYDLEGLSVEGNVFELINDVGERVALIDGDGNLYLRGSVQEFVNNVVPSSGRNFIIRKGEGNNVFIIDSAGNLELRGCVKHLLN